MTSIRIDMDLYIEAKRRGINFSNLMGRALRSVLSGKEPLSEEEAVAALIKERNERMGKSLEEIAQDETKAVENAMIDVQSAWNLYLSTGPKEEASKLSWIRAKREKVPALMNLTPEALLKELEG